MSLNFSIAVIGPDAIRALAIGTTSQDFIRTVIPDDNHPETTDTATIYTNKGLSVVDADAVIFVCGVWDAAVEDLANWYAGVATQPFVIWQVGSSTPLPRHHALEKHVLFCGAFTGVPADRGQTFLFMRNCVKYPIHALWSAKDGSFTTNGWRSLRRAFWLLDVDVDGVLNDSEILFWHNKLFGMTTDKDIAGLKTFLTRQQTQITDPATLPDDFFLINDCVAPVGFMAVCQAMILEKKHVKVWCMLHSLGCESDALPYSLREMAAMEIQDLAYTYELSASGESFFHALVTEKRFATPKEMWCFTPPVPWVTGGEVDALGGTTPTQFVLRWRNECVTNWKCVAMFARWWGYTEPLSQLFIVKKKRQFSKGSGGSKKGPSVVRAMVVGAPKCGKTSLVRYMFDHTVVSPDEESELGTYHLGTNPTTEMVLPHLEKCVTLIDMSDEDVADCIRNERFMTTIDAVLLIFDGSDPYGFSYLAKVCEMLEVMQYRKLPIVIVLSKVDLGVVEQEDVDSPDLYCAQRRLLWPPVITTVVDPATLPASMLERNEAGKLVSMVVDLVDTPELARAESVDFMSHRNSVRLWKMTGACVVGFVVIWGVVRWVRRNK